MIPAPKEIPTRVFAKLPDELRREDRPSRWVERVARVIQRPAKMGSFLEGPAFDRAGLLYVVDIAHGRVFRISPRAEWTLVAEYQGEPNGLKIHKDGRLIVTDQMHGLIEVDPTNGKTRPFLPRERIPGYKGVNDLFFCANGDCWFSDQGQMTGLQDNAGRLFRYSAAGKLDLVLDRIPSPNGLVMNLNEAMLYLAVTQMNAVWRVPLLDGEAVKVGVFSYLMGGLGPDGMALDAEGNLAVAHAGGGAVWLIDPHGMPQARIVSCTGRMTTNVAYGGPGNRTLFITESESGTVLAADLPVAGKPMYSHA
jgi:gluconolactonase